MHAPVQSQNRATGLRAILSNHAADSAVWPLAALSLLLVLQFSLVFTRAINWDEYFFYHQVAQFADGTLLSPLQTIHVRLFFWLPGLFDISVDHIVAARVAMFALEIGTLVCVYLLARRFSDHGTAALTALLYLSAGYVLQHGFSFRVDPILTFSLMGALTILATTRLKWPAIAAFSLLAGFAGMVSIKAVLFLPAFAGIALMRTDRNQWEIERILRIAACIAGAIICFILLLGAHSSDLASIETAEEQSASLLRSSLGYVFFLGIPPYWAMAVTSAMTAPILYIMIICAPLLLLRSDRPRHEKLGLIGLWMPILSIFFYMNTAGYFYVFCLAPVAVACVDAIQWSIDRFRTLVVTSAVFSIALGIWLLEDRTIIDRQRQLEREVYAIFPEPVTYIDHNFMLGGWPKANGFMTPWGMSGYRRNGTPTYRAALSENVVPLVLANWWTLRVMLDGSDDSLLVPEDNAAMRDNYVKISEFIWLAGKDFPVSEKPLVSEFLVPGTYTLQSGSIAVDGDAMATGDTINFERGKYTIVNLGKDPARLLWGDNLTIPDSLLEPGPIYVGF